MILNFIYLFINLSSIFVFIVHNPIFAAFWLILTFISSSFLIWLTHSIFFSLIYIIIYVGAIAVLFLFVIMMLDIKNIETFNFLKIYNLNAYTQTFKILLFFIPLSSFSYIFYLQLSPISFLSVEESYINAFDLINNIYVFGQVLFNHYLLCLLLIGLALLIAIIGSIILTLNINTNLKIKVISRQLSRNEKFLSYFK